MVKNKGWQILVSKRSNGGFMQPNPRRLLLTFLSLKDALYVGHIAGV